MARTTVAQHCRAASTGPECAAAAAVATSEVVTNALVHGHGPVGLAVAADPVRLRVEAGDDDRRHPRLPLLNEDDESGRGMRIADAVCSSWGVFARSVGLGAVGRRCPAHCGGVHGHLCLCRLRSSLLHDEQ